MWAKSGIPVEFSNRKGRVMAIANESGRVAQAARFSSPQEEALLTVMRAADCLHRSFQQRLKPSGLTIAQYNVLRILRGAAETGLTCTAISRMMITPDSDMTRLLSRLKAGSLVTQLRDRNDRRAIRTRISAKGLERLESLDQVMEQAPREMLGRLNCTEVAELTRLLAKAHCCSGDLEVATGGTGETPAVTGKPSFGRSQLLRHPLE